MKIVDKKALQLKNRVDYTMYRTEIREFLESGAEVAEVETDPAKGTNCNFERYKRAIWLMGADCSILRRRKKMYIVRNGVEL